MITLMSTLVSFLAGGLPKFLEFMKDRSDNKQEIALAQLQLERELQMAEKGYLAQLQVEEIRSDQVAMQTNADVQQSLLKHDAKIGEGASQWCIDLRASVRPIVTYFMLLLLAFVNCVGLLYAFYQGVDFNIAISAIITQEFLITLSSIISFWFGNQAFSKIK